MRRYGTAPAVIMTIGVRPYFLGAACCLAAALAALQGCAVGPNFHAPSAPKDAGYTTRPLADATASTPVQGGEAQHFNMGQEVPHAWWEAFGSPAINSLVQQAFRANPNVKAAQAALRQAQQMVYAQQGYFYPSVTADYSFERQMLAGNLSGSSAPGVQGNGTAINPVQSATPPYNQPLYYNLHTATVTVGFTPDVFGLNRRKVESLDAQAQMQRFELEATYLSLASNVVAAAIQEASTRAQIKATEEIIEHNEKLLVVVKEKFRLGFAMRIDVATAELQLAQAKALLAPLQLQFEQTRDLERVLIGSLPNQEISETFELASLTLPTQLPLSLPSKLIEQRPDVRAAEQQLRSANAQVGVAIANMLPQFAITGTAGGAATQFSQIFSHGGPFWTLIGDATQPIFMGGTLWHTKRAADEALHQAAAQYQATVLTAYQNVADSLHALVADADVLVADAAAERAAKALLDVTQQRSKSGFTDYPTELAAAIAYSQAVLGLAQAQATRFGDTAALYQALGGGWWNRDTAAASLPGRGVTSNVTASD
jgi:NodT family efflux transporter outer membrane factor (OMF) lipoprotein